MSNVAPARYNDSGAESASIERMRLLMMAYRTEKISEARRTRSSRRRQRAELAIAVADAFLIEHAR